MSNLTPPKVTWQAKGYRLFTLLGWILILVSFTIGAFTLAPTAADYFGNNTKAVRDAATTGSDLIGQLIQLSATGRWLEPLTFVGVSSFMVGIALEFSMIPNLLKSRGEIMKASFPILVKKGK